MKSWGHWRNTEEQPREGGQGRIFFVTDSRGEIPGTYALKELKNLRRTDRFQREIDAIARLAAHPNIIRLIDQAAFATGKPYYVMERAGGSLVDAVTGGDGAKSEEDLFAIYRAICAGVAHIHAGTIIHRDLKPENILFIGGTPKVADFGLCLIAGVDRATPTPEAVGPRLYMAPELEDGRNLDVTSAADIYSLGKILYFMLSHGRIFSREKYNEPAWDLKRVHHDPRYEVFSRVWRETMAPYPRSRFRSVGDLAAAFDEACRLFKSHPRSKLFRKLGRPPGVTAAAKDVRRLTAKEADELCAILAEGESTPDPGTPGALAGRISPAGVRSLTTILERQKGMTDSDLAAVGEKLYASAERASAMTFGGYPRPFDAWLDGAVLGLSRNRTARTNLVTAKLGWAGSDEGLLLIALNEFSRWNAEARTQILHRCAYGSLGNEAEQHLLDISRRGDLTTLQATYLVCALAYRGSKEALIRLIEMGQAIPDRVPKAGGKLDSRLQAFAGGLLLRSNIAVLTKLNEIPWKSQLLAAGIRIATEAVRHPRDTRDDADPDD